MKKLAVGVFGLSVCLYAADFWVSKPFMEWSDKDLQKMVENSPWAKQVSIAVEASGGPRMGGGGRGSMGEAGNPAQAGGIGEDPLGSAGGGGGGRRGRGGGETEAGPVASMSVTVRWQTALPVKQALVRMKYGSETATSPDAKKALETPDTLYVIAVAGGGGGRGMGMMGGSGEAFKKDLLEKTSLSVKGKDDLKPADVQVGRAAKGFELYFIFPRKAEFTLDDKEIEFVTRLQTVGIKQKFKLKDMVYNGKLAL